MHEILSLYIIQINLMQSLLQITKLQVAAGKNRNTPVLVHCSAGVGRFFLFLFLSKLFSSFALFMLFRLFVVVAAAATVVCYPHTFQDGCDDPLRHLEILRGS